MTVIELTDHDKAALAAVLRATIAADPFPLSPRVRQLRVILDQLQLPAARPQPYPAPKAAGTPSLSLARKKG